MHLKKSSDLLSREFTSVFVWLNYLRAVENTIGHKIKAAEIFDKALPNIAQPWHY